MSTETEVRTGHGLPTLLKWVRWTDFEEEERQPEDESLSRIVLNLAQFLNEGRLFEEVVDIEPVVRIDPWSNAELKISGPIGKPEFQLVSDEATAQGYVYGTPDRNTGMIRFMLVTDEGRGIGTTLAIDAMRLMKENDVEFFSFPVISPDGQGLIKSLVRKGYVSGPVEKTKMGGIYRIEI